MRTGWSTRQDTNPQAFANPAVNTPFVRTYSRDASDNTIVELTEELSSAGKNAARWAGDCGALSGVSEGKETKKAEHAGSMSANAVCQALPNGGPSDGKEEGDSPIRSFKGRNSPRRLTRQMTLARCLSTDEDDTKPTEEEKGPGITVWIGGIPSWLASNEKALHDLLVHHGGGGDSSQLLSTTVRLKESDDMDTRSWCLASFLNSDAVDNLTQAVAAEKAPSTDETENHAGGKISQLPSTLIIKLADVQRELFVRKLDSIHAGKLSGMRRLQGEQGELGRLSAAHTEKLKLSTGQKGKRVGTIEEGPPP